MGYASAIIVVEEIARSRQLYETILGLKVTADFGINNVGFEGGLSLYQKALFQDLIGRAVDLERHNNLALYFEVDDLEALEQEIARNGFEFIHPIREQPWKQRTFRFYDADHHLLEIAEKMDVVLLRLFNDGMTIAEIARLTGMPEDEVRQGIA